MLRKSIRAGGITGCAFDAHYPVATVYISGGSPSRAIAGPGFTALFDVAYLPDQDIFGNLTGAGYLGAALCSRDTLREYLPGYLSRQNPGRQLYLHGFVRTGNNDNITNAGVNALDNAAQRARADSVTRNLNVYTYTIGLGNAPGGVDDELLQRIANDPGAGNFNSLQPVGQYVFSPTTSQLNQAFSQIASSVLRLSK